MAKNLVLGSILTRLTHPDRKISFSRILFHQSLDIMVSYYHVQYKKKTDDPNLKKLTEGRTDGQTAESDFIGRSPYYKQ